MSVEPEAIRVTRYRCPFCARSHSSRTRAVQHITRCWRNPAAHGCKTCAHYEPAEAGDWTIGDLGAAEGCGADVDLTGRSACGHCGGNNYVYTGETFRPRFAAPGAVMAQCPECKGNGAEVKPGPVVHCPLWELAR
jgi:hypothetical protein